MPKLSKKTQEMRKYQAEQDNIAAARINEVLCFFHVTGKGMYSSKKIPHLVYPPSGSEEYPQAMDPIEGSVV